MPEAGAGSSGPGQEFHLIEALFAPLARHPAARGLKDDAALWEVTGPTVITCDAIVEGVHFLADDPIEAIARKALRVNLSDLAAKAAHAEGALLSLVWPRHRPGAQIAGFAAGLAQDLQAFGCALIGGDMTATPGPLTVSVTAFGRLVGGRCPARSEAKPGDDVWVSGAIGDAALGLAVLTRGGARLDAGDAAYLADRYRLPQPRLALAPLLADFAHAAMDVSDGLVADARKLAAASGVGVTLEAEAVPLSASARRAISAGLAGVDALLTGGDDYEILFTAAPEARAAIAAEADRLGLPLTRIGQAEAGGGVRCLLGGGRDLGQEPGGFVHQMGA